MLRKFLKSELFRNLIFYGLFGGLAAVVDFSVFTLLYSELGVHKLVANLISMHAGMLVSFSLNTFFNFRKTNRLLRRFASYYLIVLVGMGVSSAIIGLGSAYLPVLLLKAISIVVSAMAQFVLNRLITYRR
ncbi:MAG: GtrA family protein [Clostridia bacterium]|nr:GtrA family protein [Clostridia bacterium]